jgi:hypothetical protein
MALREQLLTLEEGFWNATQDPDYYEEHMADDGIAVFGEPSGVLHKEQAVAETRKTDGPMWSNTRLEDAKVTQLASGVVVLTYKGSALRGGQPYSAYCSSVYVDHGGRWKLALHQQSVPMQVPAEAAASRRM